MSWRRTVTLALCTLILLCFPASGSGDAPQSVYLHGDPGDKRIALTFDDGPHPVYTAEILDILDEYDIRATFFVIGTNAEGYPELIRREIESGHEIGNHTYTHTRIPDISNDELRSEVLSCEAAIRSNSYDPYLFRPPEGRYDSADLETLTRLGYSVVLWSVDTDDWSGATTEHIVNSIRNGIKGGGIILCHDFLTKKCHTAEALRIVIPELLEQGYEFVTVSELLGIEK